MLEANHDIELKKMLSDGIMEKYIKAGSIAAKVRETIRKKVKAGMPIIGICEKVESLIAKEGGKPAFPCNVSVNEIAAHYTSPPGDKSVIPDGSIVKIDIGVHVDGYIADTAVTVFLKPEYELMVLCAEEALSKAIQTIRSGVSTSHLGSEIKKSIESRGFKPVSNLTGHQVGRYLIHTGKSLPNVPHISLNKINEGDICAIEPFVTLKTAKGFVVNSPEAYIFRFNKSKSVKSTQAKRLLRYIKTNFKTLPFTERWLKPLKADEDHSSIFSQLLYSKSITAYPVFVESSHKPVAQAEHTVYIGKNEVIVLT